MPNKSREIFREVIHGGLTKVTVHGHLHYTCRDWYEMITYADETDTEFIAHLRIKCGGDLFDDCERMYQEWEATQADSPKA